MRIGLVVPHIFMQDKLLDDVIFSPGALALNLANGMQLDGQSVTLFTPGPIETKAANITANLSYFEEELSLRNDSYLDLLKKHPLTFITLARQVQSELIAKAYRMANQNQIDIVHVYTNEEDTALSFASMCQKPAVFTHHDPFNFLVNYKNIFPKYAKLNWLSISLAQRQSMPPETNWLANIYHGLEPQLFKPNYAMDTDYIAYLGRIIEPKGVHIAIEAVKKYNHTNPGNPIRLKIAGKHYAGKNKNTYWQEQIEPQIDGEIIEYVGYLRDTKTKQDFLGNARSLIIPSTYDEPFGMVMIEALACGTPVIGLESGAIPEVISNDQTGYVIPRDEPVDGIVSAIEKINQIDRHKCRQEFEARFTLDRMCREHIEAYEKLLEND